MPPPSRSGWRAAKFEAVDVGRSHLYNNRNVQMPRGSVTNRPAPTERVLGWELTEMSGEAWPRSDRAPAKGPWPASVVRLPPLCAGSTETMRSTNRGGRQRVMMDG